MGNPILIAGSLLMVMASIGAAVAIGDNHDGGKDKDGNKVPTSNKSIQSICQPTNYKDACMNSLNEAAPNTTDPKKLVQVSFQIAKKAVVEAVGKSATIQAAKADPRSAQALEICREVMEYAVNDLEKCVNSAGNFDDSADVNQFMEDLKVWMGGVITYQDVCFDAFQNCTDTEPSQKIRRFFNSSRELTSNALSLMDQVKHFISLLDIPGLSSPGPARRLLAAKDADAGAQPMAGELPKWLNDQQRSILDQLVMEIKPSVVVAQDGSEKFKTISEALATNPNATDKPFVVRIKAGIYAESVTIEKLQGNVVLIGDGPTKTVITGNKNFADGLPIYKTATVGIMGDGFMARDIGFENTAGAEKHQAVALRVVGDYAVFLNCQFDGFESTLFSVRGRHFYRDCTVMGTLDFIFGDAQAIFQNCRMVIKKPLDKQQCTVTAQGRTEAAGPGATILQNCTIVAAPQFMQTAKDQGSKAYLGRPWKPYSRVIIMQSLIESCIEPEGWTEFAGNSGIDTLYYAEFGNRGPGADTKARVTWKGIQKLTGEDVQEYTPDAFYKGSLWITPTSAPYTPGMITGV